jgi:peptidoglycan/LPS O-acetylase OafA/YrhL
MSRPAHRAEIDGLRALAVLGVVFFHAVEPTSARALQTPLEALGSRGVDLFFVLSGFCLSLPLSPQKMRTTGDVLTFVRRRFTRIAPVFYVALALFAALAATPFGLPDVTGPVAWPDQRADLVRDALFFQDLQPMHDVPMWTLGIEMRWYLVFPFALMLFYRTKIGFGLAMLAAFWLYRSVGIYDCGFLPTFMLGIVAAQLVKIESRAHAVWPFVAALALALAVRAQLGASRVEHTDFGWALAAFAVVLAVTTNAALRRAFSWRPLVAIGIASYSIYLVHMPFLDSLGWAGVPKYFAGVASVAIGIAFWYAVERPLCSRAVRGAIDGALVRAYHAMTLGKARVTLHPPAAVRAVPLD